jgi:hypothetical protein
MFDKIYIYSLQFHIILFVMKSMCLRVSFKSLVWKVGIFQNNCQVPKKQFLLVKSYMGFIEDLALGVSSYLSINDFFFSFL